MTRRPAVTLMEVLIAMFIMAIGMLALLALFPVGAVSMAQALKDDRCAYASLMAESVAIANNVRDGDLNVTQILNNAGLAPQGLAYVDPYGVSQSLPAIGFGVFPVPIQRISPLFVGSLNPYLPGSLPLIDRWFSLPDDITYTLSGTPDTSNTGGVIDRGRRYSFAYLLRQYPPATGPIAIQPLRSVQLYAVVYAGRPVNSLATTPTEWPYTATLWPPPPSGPPYTGLMVPASPTTAKRGGWILDTTLGNFYRVTNIVDSGGGTTLLETQQNLQVAATQTTMNIVIMDYVAEVFDKGYGWQQ